MTSRPHIMIVIEPSPVSVLDWGRVRREAGERDAYISLLLVSAAGAAWIVPAVPATTTSATVSFGASGDPVTAGIGSLVADKVFDAEAASGALLTTELRLLGSTLLASEVWGVLGRAERVSIDVPEPAPPVLEPIREPAPSVALQRFGPTADGISFPWPRGESNPETVGIEVKGGVMVTLLPQGTSVPCLRKETFTTADDGQTSITIRLFRGENEASADNVLVGAYEILGIPAAEPGVPAIEVTFTITDGEFIVYAVDTATHADMSMAVEYPA